MKKIFLSLIAIVVTINFSYAQYWTGGPTGPIYYTGGSVGIGISPWAKLSILGPSLGNAVSWTDQVNNTGYLRIRSTGAAIGADNNLYFETAVATSPIEMARFVGSTGYFGIGTTNPAAKLDVAGAYCYVINS